MPVCFAIMPITTLDEHQGRYGDDEDHFRHVAEYIFKPAAERAGYTFVAPAVTSSEIIQAEIIRNLEEADLVVCDITTWNANVFFELGIRVALDRPIALVRDSFTTSVPFDNALINTHTYVPRMDPWCLEAEIPKLSQFIEAAGAQTQNALWRYFGITQRAARTDPANPEDAKLDLLLAEVAELRRQTAKADSNSTLRSGIRTSGAFSSGAIEDRRMATAEFGLQVQEIIGETHHLIGLDRVDAASIFMLTSGLPDFQTLRRLRSAITTTFPDVRFVHFIDAATNEQIDVVDLRRDQ